MQEPSGDHLTPLRKFVYRHSALGMGAWPDAWRTHAIRGHASVVFLPAFNGPSLTFKLLVHGV